VAVDFKNKKKMVVSFRLGCRSVVVCSSLWWLSALIWGLSVCYSVGVVNFWWVSCLNLKVAWCGEKRSLEDIALIQVLCMVGCFLSFLAVLSKNCCFLGMSVV
jgi:hypothetical protein